MHIGLIGGIGPAATLVYYDRLTRKVREARGRLELTIVQAEVQDLIANVTNDRREAQAQIYAGLIDRLRDAGADCAAITSIGGHFCFAETKRMASLPMVSALDPLDDHFAGLGLRRIGLLGTEVVMRTRMYGRLVRTEAVAPDDVQRIGSLYQDIAVRGACTQEERTALIEAGRRMVEDQGADAVVLAGTDLGLVFDGSVDPGYPVIDALDVHVAILADLALDRRTLDGLA
jgi:aspartate racemase